MSTVHLMRRRAKGIITLGLLQCGLSAFTFVAGHKAEVSGDKIIASAGMEFVKSMPEQEEIARDIAKESQDSISRIAGTLGNACLSKIELRGNLAPEQSQEDNCKLDEPELLDAKNQIDSLLNKLAEMNYLSGDGQTQISGLEKAAMEANDAYLDNQNDNFISDLTDFGIVRLPYIDPVSGQVTWKIYKESERSRLPFVTTSIGLIAIYFGLKFSAQANVGEFKQTSTRHKIRKF